MSGGIRCPATGCTRRVGRGYVFCREHWERLPAAVRSGLFGRAYRTPSDRIVRLMERAIAILAAGPGDRPVSTPHPVPDAPAVPAADVSAPEGRSPRQALAAVKPEPAHV